MMYKYKTRINILGGCIEVRCKYKNCLEGIKYFFSANFDDSLDFTPDIVIYISLKESDRYLYRTSPSENGYITGVSYQLKGSSEILEWDSYDPPLPPFVKPPFSNNFVALHAGAIRTTNNNAILFVGPKGSGKTTSTLELVNNSDEFELLTDETVFVRKRSLLVEPFPRLVLPREKIGEGIEKTSISSIEAYKKVAQKGALITHCFLLEKSDIEEPSISEISNFESYRNLIEYYQYAGTNFEESLITLKKIADEATFSIIRYKEYDDLIQVLKNIPKIIK
ncbi:phosphoenolpyruvate carboxykinase (ATP) [Jeotgalibacillus terrae]|uniref:Aldolase n=1 Tax=Jeotgalibacillus terrae TaxID=587735 RepID=A0ABW5ZJS5_9BACL|nr:hypothetical protein [Jeotgalibacillus terrae]MBM7581136.1 hypothetical protein [Jeotgalibacillus terrae]